MMSYSQFQWDSKCCFLGCFLDIIELEFYLQVEVDLLGSEVIWYSVLLVKDSFYLGIVGLILDLYEIEDFQVQLGVVGEVKEVVGIFLVFFFVKQLQVKVNIYLVIG